MNAPFCPYCGELSKLVYGDVVYPHRGDLRNKPFYLCGPCKAWVGCHPGTTTPLGRLADAGLRKAKSAAHAAFDPFWRSGKMSRGTAYAKLGDELGIPREEVHIGMMDAERCRRVVEICTGWPQ